MFQGNEIMHVTTQESTEYQTLDNLPKHDEKTYSNDNCPVEKQQRTRDVEYTHCIRKVAPQKHHRRPKHSGYQKGT